MEQRTGQCSFAQDTKCLGEGEIALGCDFHRPLASRYYHDGNAESLAQRRVVGCRDSCADCFAVCTLDHLARKRLWGLSAHYSRAIDLVACNSIVIDAHESVVNRDACRYSISLQCFDDHVVNHLVRYKRSRSIMNDYDRD